MSISYQVHAPQPSLATLERITDDPVICSFKERRFRIGIDDDDGFGWFTPARC